MNDFLMLAIPVQIHEKQTIGVGCGKVIHGLKGFGWDISGTFLQNNLSVFEGADHKLSNRCKL